MWNLVRPSITGVIVDGVAILLAGLFSCTAWWWVEDARATSVMPLRGRPMAFERGWR